MNRPTLPLASITAEQFESGYALLRLAGQCTSVRLSDDQWFQLPELDAYAKALAAFNLLSTICGDFREKVGVTDDLARQAGSALGAVAELENSLGALVLALAMVRNAEEQVP